MKIKSKFLSRDKEKFVHDDFILGMTLIEWIIIYLVFTLFILIICAVFRDPDIYIGKV